jgi:hypothetical protein
MPEACRHCLVPRKRLQQLQVPLQCVMGQGCLAMPCYRASPCAIRRAGGAGSTSGTISWLTCVHDSSAQFTRSTLAAAAAGS